ncbi:sensor histidine kinase [Amycolatopsis nigrescens]|uniref:sensor histidine kinase n=1 Tax=Amycolatopsis nigrescens TaxID=381445 RepID=UPI000379D8C9|nr:HAMP domain-containing sensor histidine kinase [Amycolatopsis nigrescens]
MRRSWWPLPIRAKSALAAALACAVVFTAGGLWLRHVVHTRVIEQAKFLTSQALDAFANTRFARPAGDPDGPSTSPQTSLDGHTFEVVLDTGEVAVRSQNLATYYPTRAPFPPAPPGGIPAGGRFLTADFGAGAVPGVNNNLEHRTFAVQRKVVHLPAEVVTPPGRTGYQFLSGLPEPLVLAEQTTYVRATVYLFVDPYSAERAVGGVDAALGGGIPLAVLFVAVLAWIVAGRALRPVEAIRAEMAEISEHALPRRVPVPAAHDEIAHLATTTNATLDRLYRALHQQQQFVADASHELRSPLTNLRTWLEVARAHPGQADWPTVAEHAVHDIDRMHLLITDLLLLAQHDANHPTSAETVDLTAIADEQAAERRYLNPHLTIDCHAEIPALVRGNPAQLHRLLRNLLDNACRHALSSITITTRHATGTVSLEVLDDGPGIPPADRERVFDRFTRLDEARTRDAGGTGLGLAIARAIAHRHGGTLHILDVADSPSGARFVTTLPTTGDLPR